MNNKFYRWWKSWFFARFNHPWPVIYSLWSKSYVLKVKCVFPIVVLSEFRMNHAAWGSIGTTTIRKTHPTLLSEILPSICKHMFWTSFFCNKLEVFSWWHKTEQSLLQKSKPRTLSSSPNQLILDLFQFSGLVGTMIVVHWRAEVEFLRCKHKKL